LSARAFRPGATRPRCERSRGVPVFHRVAGLAPGNPACSRRWTPPGPGGPKAARRPQGRAVPLVVSLMVSLVVSLVVSLRVRSGEGNRARPGFSGRPGVPSGGRMGPGDGSRRDPGSGGGAAASEPSSAISGITNGIISGIISGITKGVDGGRRSGAPEFLRAAPWERASPGPGSRGQPQNPILEHKARFYGVSVIFADPQNTSRACPVCGRVGERRRGPVRACPCGARMSRRAAAALFSLGRAFPGISPDAESGLEESARMGPTADAGGGPIPKARLADPRASRIRKARERRT
jgi:hypothetical protein